MMRRRDFIKLAAVAAAATVAQPALPSARIMTESGRKKDPMAHRSGVTFYGTPKTGCASPKYHPDSAAGSLKGQKIIDAMYEDWKTNDPIC